MPELSPEQQMRIRQLLDEGDRLEARRHREEVERLKYRPWLWFGAAGRWVADWIDRNRLARTTSRPAASPSPAPTVPLTDAQKVERLRRSLRSGTPPSDP